MLSQKNLPLYFHTLRHLKRKQILYRIYYALRNRIRKLSGFEYPRSASRICFPLQLVTSIPSAQILHENAFTFLNKTHAFSGPIDWDFSHFGKLWTYNLNYFDYLQQPHMTAQKGLRLIHAFIHAVQNSHTGFESYPLSLRAINWIKFLSFQHISDNIIASALYAQYRRLLNNLEYHLLGNHLLENGFALLFGAYFFQDEILYAGARDLLIVELKEQILPDGGHFELSPMYHQIVLYRILDGINLVAHNEWHRKDLLGLLMEKAGLMLGWLDQMTFTNGDIPLVNDAVFGIAPMSEGIFAYANRLGIKRKIVPLKESGYRKISKGSYEMVLDVGDIGPDYIPGHAHSDTFSFVLYAKGNPFIVDTGISTYEAGSRRQMERGTAAHNTVRVANLDQSEVWGGFRVARRARVTSLKEGSERIEAFHDGYKRIGVLHQREFAFSDNKIRITDKGFSGKRHSCRAFLHFYPGIEVVLEKSRIQANGNILNVRGAQRIKVMDYDYSPQFNVHRPAKVVEIAFTEDLETEILIRS